MTVLQLEDLAVGGRVAEVSLTAQPGEVVALAGPNGAGKSTLLRATLGGERTSGGVAWFGRPFQAWRRRELARRVAFLGQTPAWPPGETAAHCLASGRSPHWGAFGVESDADRIAVETVAERLQLRPWLKRSLDTLSGGERQRVLLGRSLAQVHGSVPAALLLDEPDANLDLARRAELAATIRSLAAGGLTIVLASHDLTLAAEVADRVVLLSGGRVIAQGPPAMAMTAATLTEAYGVPVRLLRDGDRIVPIGMA